MCSVLSDVRFVPFFSSGGLKANVARSQELILSGSAKTEKGERIERRDASL